MDFPMLRRKIRPRFHFGFWSRTGQSSVRFPLLGAAFTALWMTACTASAPPNTRLTVQIHSEPTTLDPAEVEDGLGFRILMNLYRGLYRYDSRGSLVPDLADRVVWSPDGRTLTLFLRKDAKWSDGAALKLDEVLFAFERARSPKIGARMAPLLKSIDRIEALAEGGGIRFHLNRPSPLFLHLLTLPMTFPIRREWVGKDGRFAWREKWSTLAFSAPYRLSGYERDRSFDLEAWAPIPKHAPTQTRFLVVQDETTAANLMAKGDLDVLSKVPLFETERFKKEGRLRSYPFLATYFLAFRPERSSTLTAAVRRKIQGSIDREAIVRMLGGGERVADSWIPPGIQGHYTQPHASPSPSIALATDGRDKKIALTLVYDSGERNSLIAQKIQADIKKNTGIQIALEAREWKTHVQSIRDGSLAFYRYGWFSPILDPAFFLMAFEKGGPFSLFSTTGELPQIAPLLELQDGKEREAALIAFQKKWVDEEALVIPIFHYVNTVALAKRVESYPLNPLGYIHLEDVRLASGD